MASLLLTLHDGHGAPCADGATAAVLTKTQLEKEEGKSSKEQHDDVRDEKCTCTDSQKDIITLLNNCVKNK